jgi:predicted permease
MSWEYQELLNQNLQILFVLGLGALCAYLKLFNQLEDLRTLNKIVFAILLPASVLLGLGLRTNLRDGATWRFIGGFIMLRAICLGGSAAVFYKKSLGTITANWLFASWVSTVILGVPLIRAALGAQYSNLGVVAGISSFIFQLPAMLILFEIDKGRQEAKKLSSSSSWPSTSLESQPNQQEGGNYQVESIETITPSDGTTSTILTTNKETASSSRLLTYAQMKFIAISLLKNPILWAILIGIIVSVTTLGPRYLNPGNPPAQPNCDYVAGTGFIFLILSSLAACTEPIALLATGIFLLHKSPVAIGWLQVIGYMLVKLIIAPAIAVGCCFAVGLDGGPARASVLLASLPISAAAFTLCDRYSACLQAAVTNIFWGTVLVLPTTLGWMAFLDAVDLFPLTKTPVPDVCAAPPATG